MALDAANKVLQPIISRSPQVTQAWVLTAMTAQAQSDYVAAENAYRRVLARTPNSPDCLNDLAYLLWLRGRETDIAEARQMAESAVALRPNEASFYDTLARIQVRAGQLPLAKQTFRMALQKDPNSVEAMIGQADLLARDPAAREEAKGLIAQVHRLLDEKSHLSSVLESSMRPPAKPSPVHFNRFGGSIRHLTPLGERASPGKAAGIPLPTILPVTETNWQYR